MNPRPDDELDRTAPGRAGKPPDSGAPSEPDATLLHSSHSARSSPPPRPPAIKPAPATLPDAPVPADAPPADERVFGGRFEVVSVIGEGGMGKVYSVRDRQIEGRAVALKVLLPKFSRNEKFRSLFFQEIRAAQNFVSEHVVQVRDCGQLDDGRLFVTMDLVQGESLRDLLAREETLRPRHALEIARQTLLALQSGHERGFVHRDVKPSNVMLATRVAKTDENPHGVGARVLDFGIAGIAAELEAGNVAGTPLYMSPEQIQGQRLDARSDLFAVGVVLYESLSGSRPFEGKTLEAITTSVMETDLAPRIAEMKELSAPIRRILGKALQKNRDQRFQSATDFIHAIETSSAYKLPSTVPAWAWAALVLLASATAVAGWMTSSKATRIETLERDRMALQAVIDGAQSDLTSKLNAKDDELRKANERIASMDTAMAKSGAKEDTQLSELRGQLNTLEHALGLEKAAREAAAKDKQTLDQELLRMRQEQDRLSAALDEAERERSKLTAQLDPAARKARAFDDVLSLLERGGGAQAQALWEQSVAERIFERPVRAGSDLLQEVVASALAYERFDASRAASAATPDIQALLEANKHLTAAESLRDGYAMGAKEWLAFGDAEGTPRVRLERLDARLKSQAGAIRPEIAALGAHHEREWTRISAAGLEQGPREALGHAELFACDHFAALARSVATNCEAKLAPGGKLDVRALAAAAYLDDWGAHLASHAAARDAADATLLAFSYARRWYDSDESNDASFDLARLAPSAITAASHDWRAVLRLQIELAQPESGYPIKSGRRLVFRTENGSPMRWRVLELGRGAQATAEGPWDLTQTNYKVDALPIGAPEPLRLVRRRGRYVVEGASDPLLDLKAAGDSVWVAPFPSLFDQALPPQLGVSQVVMQEHRDRIGAGVGPCLVYKRGALLRWFSPEFGLVLEELENQPVRTELVFATPLR